MKKNVLVSIHDKIIKYNDILFYNLGWSPALVQGEFAMKKKVTISEIAVSTTYHINTSFQTCWEENYSELKVSIQEVYATVDKISPLSRQCLEWITGSLYICTEFLLNALRTNTDSIDIMKSSHLTNR